MFKIESEKDLLECFRPLDRSAVAPAKDMKFPLFVRDFLAWPEASGARTFLVFPDPASEKLLGVSFRRDQPRGPGPHFCEWCHSTGTANEIGLLTADSSAKRRVGVHTCLGLECVAKIEGRSYLTGENARKAVKDVVAKMAEFARKTLF
jgi:hypothetical protein